MRIVLDTNVLIASFVTRGVCRDLVDHCIRRHDLLTSEFILNEFRDTLVEKFGVNKQQAEDAVVGHFEFSPAFRYRSFPRKRESRL